MISVIGAGPAGSRAAQLLAEAGREVQVFEEHGTVGEPVACTGIITGILEAELALPKSLIVNVPEKARIYAPNGSYAEVKLKNDVILDRAGLDQFLARQAQKAGARYHLNHRYRGHEANGRITMRIEDTKKNNSSSIETDILIGADGPHSRVAKNAGLLKRKFYAGLQYTAAVEMENVIEFYPLRRGIAWVVPEAADRAKVGVATEKQPQQAFSRFMQWRFGDRYQETLSGRQASAIPLYNPAAKTQNGNVYVVGDAAGMVKAPTLGGINQSLIGARCLAAAITEGKDYQREWRKNMGKDLYYALLIRKMLNNCRAGDINLLVRLFRQKKVSAILEQVERDTPSKFALQLLLREPRLLYFARFLL